jgi:hypothetical protein
MHKSILKLLQQTQWERNKVKVENWVTQNTHMAAGYGFSNKKCANTGNGVYLLLSLPNNILPNPATRNGLSYEQVPYKSRWIGKSESRI